METMKAVRIHEFGDPEVLRYEEVQGKVMVQVYAVGINPAGWKVRQGYIHVAHMIDTRHVKPVVQTVLSPVEARHIGEPQPEVTERR